MNDIFAKGNKEIIKMNHCNDSDNSPKSFNTKGS